MRYIVFLFFASVCFWGCQPDEACISSATNRLALGFFQQTPTGPVADTMLVGQVRSTTSDSLFWNNDTTATTGLLLQLNPALDTTIFVFEGPAPNRQRDTLILAYQRRYRLIAPDCPLEVLFEELAVVRSTFGDTRIINTELREPSNDIDVQVYY